MELNMLSKRAGLVALLVEYAKAMGGHHENGAFKYVWRIEHGSRTYALKLGRPDVWDRHQQKMGTGEEDLLREVTMQVKGVLPRGSIVPYLAWAWVDGRFYAAQPWCGDEGVSWDDVSTFDETWEVGDTHTGNVRWYRGTLRAIDYGWVEDGGHVLRLEEGTAQRVRFSYREAA